MFDWTITLGNIVEIAGIIGGGLLFLSKMTATIDRLDYRLKHLESTIEAHGAKIDSLDGMLVLVARQDERLTSLSARIEEVRSDRRQYEKDS